MTAMFSEAGSHGRFFTWKTFRFQCPIFSSLPTQPDSMRNTSQTGTPM